ncbi:MAG: MMPL family transporter [Actinomycetota bacterium]
MNKLFAIPAGRRAKWVIFITFVVALIITAGPANLPKKFSDNEQNETTSFLPGSAESTKALKAADEIRKGERVTAVIVYRRPSGLTSADQATISDDKVALDESRAANVSPFRGPIFSTDGTAALLTAEIKTNGEGKSILDPVTAMRKEVSNPGGGLEVKVTGGAGYSADAIKIFEGINGTLLLAAGGLVFLLLILIYRSPIFLWIPLLAVGFAEIGSRAVGYFLTEMGVTVNGQASSILSILVLGAGTDYALLLVARYREELRKHEDKHEALALALRSAGPAIFASGITVIASLLCLSLAQVNGTAGLGPIGAMGVAVAMVSMLTVLPAMLVITGRWAFWPRVPRFGDSGADETHGSWRKVGERVAARPRRVWVGSLAILIVFSLGLLNYNDGLTQGNSFRGEVESVQGQQLLSKSFPSGTNAPTDVIVGQADKVDGVIAAAKSVPGVAAVAPVGSGASGELLSVTLKPAPYTTEAFDVIPDLRAAVKRAGGGDVLVGGPTAVERDLRVASNHDTLLIVPITLLVVFLILILLLRSVLAPLLLIGTVILSFAASLGVGVVVFDLLFGFPGNDPGLPLFAFVFLVALGIDYNIFLMARVREETLKVGTRSGMLRGLAVTGGVITSAGIVLAGTFAILAVLPLVFLTELGFVIAFGVLLDTFLVRSVLVPALVFDIGPKVWWPSRLAQRAGDSERDATSEEQSASAT